MKPITIIIFAMFLFLRTEAQVFQEWAQRFNGPDSLYDTGTAIDADGNVYVVGRTFTLSGERIVTLKYSPGGILLWWAIAMGRQTAGIVVDASGNAYITGMGVTGNYLIIKYDANGNELWTATVPSTLFSSAIAMDNNNNVYVTGAGSYNKITTVKYTADGVQQWLVNFQNNPATGQISANDLAVDLSGNVIITGYSYNGANFDFITLKYNSNGVLQWTKYYNGTANGYDNSYSIALDNNNNVYITGGGEGTGTGLDYVTIKYNANGVQQWLARYNGPGNYTDLPKGVNTIAVANEKVYVTGRSIGAAGNFDYATIQYNKNGALLWVQRYDGPGVTLDDDIANALTVDKEGSVYVTGQSNSYGSTAWDYLTIKYEKNGTLAWIQRYDGPANSVDAANAITLDSSANVYVTGMSLGTNTGFDIATVKYVQTTFPNAQNEFTVEDFEIELTAALNASALKKSPTDVSYNRIKEVGVTVNNLQVEMLTDSTAKISRKELQRVYTKVRNDVWSAARNEFESGKDRVLGFLLDEEIIVMHAPKGTLQEVTIKLTGLIGFGLNQMLSCIFDIGYAWSWYDPSPDQNMLNDLEAVLNEIPPCLPNYISTCPEPGNTVHGLPNTTVLYQIDGSDCSPASPFICIIAFASLSCVQPCPAWSFSTTDLQNLADYVRQEALGWKSTVMAEVPCLGYDVAPAPFFEIGYHIEGFNTSYQIRYLTATYHYYGCGPCRGISMKIH